MIDPSDDDADRDRVMRLIRARCPELTDDDLTLIGTIHPAVPSAEPDLPVEIGRDIMSVREAMEMKLDQFVEAIGDGDADDLTG